MRKFTIFLANRPFPVVIVGDRHEPYDLLLSGAHSGYVAGTALAMDGEMLSEPMAVQFPFEQISRIGVSSLDTSSPR